MSSVTFETECKTLDHWIDILKCQDKNARAIGFYWENDGQILDQIISECAEVRAAASTSDTSHHREEIGDLLHAVLTLCFYHDIDIGDLLKDAYGKFQGRFLSLEKEMTGAGLKTLSGLSFDDLKCLWERAKKNPATP